MSPSGLASSPSRRPFARQAFSARILNNHTLSILHRGLVARAVVYPCLKDRLGHGTRPEGRDEPAPFAALRAGFQRTGVRISKSTPVAELATLPSESMARDGKNESSLVDGVPSAGFEPLSAGKKRCATRKARRALAIDRRALGSNARARGICAPTA